MREREEGLQKTLTLRTDWSRSSLELEKRFGFFPKWNKYTFSGNKSAIFRAPNKRGIEDNSVIIFLNSQ